MGNTKTAGEQTATLSTYKKLAEVQQKLKAPKSQFNEYGKYHYRNCEDILEAVKPLLGEYIMLVEDEIVQIGDRFYVKAIAKFGDGITFITNKAYARESLDKKGMDDAQITGATSSYARKYALNGLLLIDDTKDADSKDNRQPKQTVTTTNTNVTVKPANVTTQAQTPTAYPASEKQLTYLCTLVTNKGVDETALKAHYQIKSYKELSSSQASSIIANLQQRPDKVKAKIAQPVQTAQPVSTPTATAAEQPKPTVGQDTEPVTKAKQVTNIMARTDLTAEQKAIEMQKVLGLVKASELPIKK